ncbi:dehydrogenase/reductase SDR family member 7-like isoform X2 [Orbicella faveolata]|uniref:dehydrogenase/reductase SDR family member 7-like isoform X2 n=1 Tax=Orbicella faveolata TaxID=48498 RepID=UPI0009E58FFC|nr:dehydrogenase/reductase SDR family member 7-like isoform X2 [Orbicella faveolata]
MIERHEGQIVVGYFDTARLELAEHNIHVQTVLPGPVKTNISLHFFTENIDEKFKDPPDISGLQLMSTERCAELMVVSMANNLDEVWISSEPGLLMVYLNQYFPNLYRWLTKMFLMEATKTILQHKEKSAAELTRES